MIYYIYKNILFHIHSAFWLHYGMQKQCLYALSGSAQSNPNNMRKNEPLRERQPGELFLVKYRIEVL